MYSKEYEAARKEFYNCLRMGIIGLGCFLLIVVGLAWLILRKWKENRDGSTFHIAHTSILTLR